MRRVRWVALAFGLAACVWLVLLAMRAHERRQYPYGPSHSCDKGLMFALYEYAKDNDGRYPTGQETPEASLGLLYPKYANPGLLCGKMISADVTAAQLEKGLPLTPETCGWRDAGSC